MTSQPLPLVAVVEDDAPLRKALGRLLRAGGFEPLLFESAEEFLAAAPSAHCIVLDVCLPGMSGLDLLEKLHAAGSRPPIILMTAGHDAAVTDRARKSDCAAFFLKPFDGHALIDTVSSLVQRIADTA